MAFLLDTNVISETFKPRPAARVIAWFSYQRSDDLFLASMSLGELVRGRILPFDQEAAMIWGEIMGDGDRTGRPKPTGDAQIAAVARRHHLTLVTRNTRDFTGMDVALLDPWHHGALLR